MTMTAPRRAILAALLLPLLGGCFVTSENPVLRAGEDGRNPALRGLWADETGREFLHVLRPERESEGETGEAPGFSGLFIVSREGGDEAGDNWTRARMISTSVKGRNILSVRFFPGEGGSDMDDIPGWMIFSWAIRHGQLFLYMIDEEAVIAAIDAGKLKGISGTNSSADPHVTASAEEWIAFLEKADLSALFQTDDGAGLYRLEPRAIRSLMAAPESPDRTAN